MGRELAKKLENAMNPVFADQVRAERLVLKQHLETQHLSYFVGTKLRVMSSAMLQDGDEFWKTNVIITPRFDC